MKILSKILKTSPIAEGGEGILYEYDNQIFKIYKDTVNKSQKEQKIKLLISKNLPKNIISPIDCLYDKNNNFIGYVMNKVEGNELKKLGSRKFVKTNNITTKETTKLLIQILDTLKVLHEKNIFISDFNDSNILFDNNFNIYFIDVDSWTVDNYKCDVCMESFKDPKLVANNFSEETDNFAFAILIFKVLTMLHPFGGTMNPDINLLDRMNKKISVIDNKDVKIPSTIKNYNFISPNLLKDLKEIYEHDKRYLVNKTLIDFCNNLKYCDKCQTYYYAKFNDCPICNNNAKVISTPTKQINTSSIPYTILFNKNAKFIFNINTYLDTSNNICFTKYNKNYKFEPNCKFYFSNDGEILYKIYNSYIDVLLDNKQYHFEKLNKSNVEIIDNKIYYINLNKKLVELTIDKKGNFINQIQDVTFNNIFNIISKDKYLICNCYDDRLIININGSNYIINEKINIQQYGIKYDKISNQWLLIIFDGNKFRTMIFKNNKLEYKEENISYSTDLNNIAFYNNTIFIPYNGFIRGFNYIKNAYKDFNSDIVTESSSLIKDKKFTIINDNIIYELG